MDNVGGVGVKIAKEVSTWFRNPPQVFHTFDIIKFSPSVERLTPGGTRHRVGISPLACILELFFSPYNRLIESNAEQLQAVTNIVNGCNRPAPYIIYGPPGTGKTVTIVESIKQVKKLLTNCRIDEFFFQDI